MKSFQAFRFAITLWMCSIVSATGAFAQPTAKDSVSKDSMTAEIVKIMSEKLSKCNQLELLQDAMEHDFDVTYEMKMIMEGMTKEEVEDLLIKTMRKAGIPIQPKESSTEFTKVSWEEVEYDFGVVMKGKKVTHTFKFENIGKIPLLIENVTTSCGCTASSWTQEPVMPNESGILTITFDTTNKSVGTHNEFVTVIANTFPRRANILITAFVR